MATTIVAAFTNAGAPATGLAATIRIRRTDTGALVVTDAAMTEQGDGGYSYAFAPVDGLDYSIRADGTATLGASDRYKFGSLSGGTEARINTDVPAILVDTTSLDTTKLTAGRALNLDNLDAAITSRPTAAQIDTTLSASHGAGAWGSGGGLTAQDVRDAMKLAPTAGAPAAGSVDTALDNIETNTDTLLARLTATRAALLDSLAEVTALRMAELDPANLPAEVDAIRARVDFELVRIHKYLGLLVGTPAVHTPASVVAGSISQTVGVLGSTVTKTALT